MERGTDIPFNLQSNFLQIKTNSTTGSNALLWVDLYGSGRVLTPGFGIQFISPIKYEIGYCSNRVELPVQPGEELDKIWSIGKTDTTLTIDCNGVEVLNYKFSDSSDSNCAVAWEGAVTTGIQFHPSWDSASISYRAQPSGELKTDKRSNFEAN